MRISTANTGGKKVDDYGDDRQLREEPEKEEWENEKNHNMHT
jgi:hypothetical protein